MFPLESFDASLVVVVAMIVIASGKKDQETVWALVMPVELLKVCHDTPAQNIIRKSLMKKMSNDFEHSDTKEMNLSLYLDAYNFETKKIELTFLL